MKRISHRIFTIVCVLTLLAVPVVNAQFFVFENPLVGKASPEFVVNTLKGGRQSMDDFRDGKSAIIFFWATWCPHCRKQLTELGKIKKELDQEGIKVILVDVQESVQQVRSFMDKNKLDFEVFLDEDQSVAENYGIVGVPTFFFLDKNGIIRAVEHEIPSNYQNILLGS